MPRTAAVIGAGTMGHGIAQVAALAGCTVRLVDLDAAALDVAVARIDASLAKGEEKGKLGPGVREAALGRILKDPHVESGCRDADLVIEAVPERLDLKAAVLSQAADVAAPDAIIASNTSSLSIGAIADATPAPDRVVGLHFFNPPPIMRLVEVVVGPRTSEAVREASVDLVREFGKVPIVVQDSPGFATSRLGLALGLEAMRMVEAGVASPEDIDTAMELGYNHPVGPLKLTDMIGLDVRLAIAEHLHAELGSVFEPPRLLRDMVKEGRLGRKSGEGFYRYDTK